MNDDAFMSPENYLRISQPETKNVIQKAVSSFHFDNSTLTADEYYRLNGTLDPSRIEALLSLSGLMNVIYDVDCSISEAKAQFPEEDFLSPMIERMQAFSKNMRGPNREAMLRLIEQAEEIQSSTHRATEYGLLELRAAEKSIKEVS